MKLFIDDIREAPAGWTLVRSISEAVNVINRYWREITHISFDHDISIPVKVNGEWYNRPSPDTFKVVAEYFKLFAGAKDNLEYVATHSSNPVGRKSIVELFNDIGITCAETPYEAAFRDGPERL